MKTVEPPQRSTIPLHGASVREEEEEPISEEFVVQPRICGCAMTSRDSIFFSVDVAVEALQVMVLPGDIKELSDTATEDLLMGPAHTSMVVRHLPYILSLLTLYQALY